MAVESLFNRLLVLFPELGDEVVSLLRDATPDEGIRALIQIMLADTIGYNTTLSKTGSVLRTVLRSKGHLTVSKTESDESSLTKDDDQELSTRERKRIERVLSRAKVLENAPVRVVTGLDTEIKGPVILLGDELNNARVHGSCCLLVDNFDNVIVHGDVFWPVFQFLDHAQDLTVKGDMQTLTFPSCPSCPGGIDLTKMECATFSAGPQFKLQVSDFQCLEPPELDSDSNVSLVTPAGHIQSVRVPATPSNAVRE
jgi:hypothetical protein